MATGTLPSGSIVFWPTWRSVGMPVVLACYIYPLLCYYWVLLFYMFNCLSCGLGTFPFKFILACACGKNEFSLFIIIFLSFLLVILILSLLMLFLVEFASVGTWNRVRVVNPLCRCTIQYDEAGHLDSVLPCSCTQTCDILFLDFFWTVVVKSLTGGCLFVLALLQSTLT